MQEAVFIREKLDGEVWRHQGKSGMHSAHSHDVLEMNLIVRGEASYQMKSRRYHMTPRSMVWLFPRHTHQLIDCSEDFFMWIVVFRPSFVRKQATQPRYMMLRKDNPAGWFCRLLSRVDMNFLLNKLEENDQLQENPDLHRAILLQLMLQAWDYFVRTNNEPVHSELHPAIEKACTILSQNKHADKLIIEMKYEEKKVDLTHLSQLVHLSPARLSRLFHQQMGITITDYKNKLRIEHALKQYGMGQRITMLQAALESGFGSYAQFYRIFTQVTGKTPREYAHSVRAIC